MSTNTAWDIIVEGMSEEGVEHLFGLPGNPHALYDSLYDSDIEPILVRHEASGVYMAYAYGKLSRKPGVCYGSPGPGVANMVSGVLEAWSGCVPMLVLGSSADLEHEGMGAFQEAPQVDMLEPITKWSYRIKDADRAPWALRRALTMAVNGKPGPVYLDVPFDVGLKETEKHYRHSKPLVRLRPEMEGVKQAAELLLNAESPVIVAGGGALYSGASAELISLAEGLGIPILTTPCGRGVIPESHPLAFGLVGLYRTHPGKRAYQESDLLITLGSRNEEFQTAGWRYYPEDAKYVQVDIDASEIGRNWDPDVAVVADVKLFLQDLFKAIREIAGKVDVKQKPYLQELIRAKEDFKAKVEEECSDASKPLKTKRIVHEASKVFGEGTILVNENGSQDLWSYYYPYYQVLDLDGCVAPAEQTCMGLGVVGAIGAKLARPDRKVICTTGDGAFQMVMQEISTAVQYDAPVTWLVMNNYSLGWIKLHQWANKERYISVDFEAQPDFAMIAEACGCHGQRVTEPGQVKTALETALTQNERGIPAVIDFIVDPMDFPEGFKEFHPTIFDTQ
ncbi:MAG: thiamine pyrophosphate-binding protein [Candidatus Bathyarchaeia archaeon]